MKNSPNAAFGRSTRWRNFPWTLGAPRRGNARRRIGPAVSARAHGRKSGAAIAGFDDDLAGRAASASATDAPNILIVLLDDVGFGISETFGGEVRTPTLSRLAAEGISYNAFHTTSICSPTRASLLTGRNHTRVGSGTIAERAVAFDGYTGVIPKSAATIAEVLKNYGYHTAAFGKWHNTPATETTVDRPEGPLAERLWLRIFLRLPRRRDLAMGAAPDRELRRGRAAARRSRIIT